MTFPSLQHFLEVLVPVLQAAIAILMWRRKLVKTFPIFFAYMLFHLVRHFAELAAMPHPMAYFWVWWGAEALDAFITLAVIQEIFGVVFEPYDAFRTRGIAIFRWLTFALFILAAVTAIIFPAAETNRQMATFFVLDRSAQFIILGLLFFLFVFCKLFGMTWRHYIFGIAAGFLIMTSVSAADFAVRAHEGQRGNFWHHFFGPVGFTLGNIVWTYYFVSAKSLVPLKIVPRTDQLIAWNQALSRVEQR